MTKIKKLSFALFIGVFVILSAFTINDIMHWQIKDGYKIQFSGAHVKGNFDKINGDITFDTANLAASHMSINVEVESITTGFWLKNSHAKSDKWFDADKYPQINFTSSHFSNSATGYLVEGILTIHGVKKQVSIPFTFSNNIFKGSFTINRLDYGVGNLEGMSKKVSNEIKLEISVPVDKK